MSPRTIVIGDIHGGLLALEQLLSRVGLCTDDRLVFLGDYVDGWSGSAQVIDFLITLDKERECMFIRGNHDTWCEGWLRGDTPPRVWLLSGGAATIESYSGFSNTQQQEHLEFFNRMRNYYVDEQNRLYIHAGFSSMHGPSQEHYESNYSWDRTLWEVALTMDKRIRKDSKLYPKRLLLFHEIFIGHTPMLYYDVVVPMQGCNVWNLDTGAAFHGKLSALDVDTKQYWQSDTVQQLYPHRERPQQMTTLNLINPEHSDICYKAMLFPDGQPHLKLDMASVEGIDRAQPLRILARIANAADLLLLLFAKNALDYLEFAHVELHLSYLLAARMDRVMLEGEPFSLKVLAAMLNSATFKKVKIFDPHSEVSTALIDRSYAVPNHAFVRDAMAHYLAQHTVGAHCLVSPDAGALKKIHKLAAYLNIDNVVECMKERDLKTGTLTSFKTATEDLNGETCFIVDDICDGGGTFAGTAQMLKGKGAQTIVLIVSHGIFSKGIAIPGVDAIYTTDSYRSVEGVACFSVEKYLM